MTRTRIALFVFFQALYALTSSGHVFRLSDEYEVYFQAEHLVDAGDLSVPQAVAIRRPVVVNGTMVRDESMFIGRIGRDGKPYAPYGPLVGVLALPHHLAGRGVAAWMGLSRSSAEAARGSAWLLIVSGITMLASATAAALAVVGFHRACIALATPSRTALALSVLLGGATVLWPYASSLFSEAFIAACLIWAAAFLIEARTSQRPLMRVAAAAGLIVIAGLTKFSSLAFALAFVPAILAEPAITAVRRRQVAALVVGAILAATALQFGWNAYRFGSIFEFGYDWTGVIAVMPLRFLALEAIPRGAALHLFAPGKSLFVWAPILVLSVINARATWRHHRPLAIGLLTAAVIGLLLYGAYPFPEGGYSHGPRHFVPIVPLLALAAAGGRTYRNFALYGCLAAGMLTALPATAISYREDQAPRLDDAGRAIGGYYQAIESVAGRPRVQYRLGYLPFVRALGSGGWLTSPIIGSGPDYFFIHLQQARGSLADGEMIPEEMSAIWALGWFLIALTAVAYLLHEYNRADHGVGNPRLSASY